MGDDLLVTNVERIKTGIEKKACTGLLLKVYIYTHTHTYTHTDPSTHTIHTYIIIHV